jgi:hypothetical protein
MALHQRERDRPPTHSVVEIRLRDWSQGQRPNFKTQALARFRIPEQEVKSLPLRRPPAWSFLHGLKSPLSSTTLRMLRRKRVPAKKRRAGT